MRRIALICPNWVEDEAIRSGIPNLAVTNRCPLRAYAANTKHPENWESPALWFADVRGEAARFGFPAQVLW